MGHRCHPTQHIQKYIYYSHYRRDQIVHWFIQFRAFVRLTVMYIFRMSQNYTHLACVLSISTCANVLVENGIGRRTPNLGAFFFANDLDGSLLKDGIEWEHAWRDFTVMKRFKIFDNIESPFTWNNRFISM